MRSLLRIVSLLLVLGCIEPVDTRVAFERVLRTVQGRLLSGNGTSEIFLSGFAQSTVVTIIDGDGREVTLDQFPFQGELVYRTDSTQFQPEIGQTYMLRIESQGKTFESEWMDMPGPLKILETNPTLVTREFEDGNGVTKFVQSHVITQEIENVERPLHITTEAQGFFKRNVVINPSCPPFDDRTICWAPVRLPAFEIGSNVGKLAESFSYEPLEIPFEANGLVEVEMATYSITEREFTFLNKIIRQNDRGNSIFEAPIPTVVGNLFNVDDPDDLIYGFFGTATKRVDPLCYFQSGRFSDPVLCGDCANGQITECTLTCLNYFERATFEDPETCD